MNWINPPDAVRRFSLQQMLQHAAAVLLACVLVLSALLPKVGSEAHWIAGIGASVLFCIHLFSLLAIGVRHDVATEQIAFLPFGTKEAGAGKYTLPEKRDYFLILSWSLLVVASGLVLHWPGKFGIPGPKAFAWFRIVHAAVGAGCLLHLLACHVPFRFIDAPDGMRWSIFNGKASLGSVEGRSGWTRALVEAGVLVPVPVEPQGEAQRETTQVRELLEEGNRLTRESRFDEAAAVFEEALRLYPEYSQARFNLAVSRLKQGETGLAAGQFRIFLETDPFNPMAGKARELLDGIANDADGGGK
jgi:hypothetical protein